MDKIQAQIYYQAHMLDEAFNKNINEAGGKTELKKLPNDASYSDIKKTIGDDSLEVFCRELDFLRNGDPKSEALYKTFKKGWKTEFKNIKVSPQFVSIKELHPTQNVIFVKKSLEPVLKGKWPKGGAAISRSTGKQLAEDFLNPKTSQKVLSFTPDRIVVCEVGGTNYLIDGHHRWSKVYAINPNAKMAAWVIQQSFNSADAVLKFAQGTIAASTIDDDKKFVSPQKAGDKNLYEVSAEELKKDVKEWTTDEVLNIFKTQKLTKDKVKDINSLGDYIVGNVEEMKQSAPAGKHGREYMPQFPDGKTNPKSNLNDIKAESRKMYRKHRNIINESIKNSILGFLKIRSNFTEFEDLVDDIANKRASKYKLSAFARRLQNDSNFTIKDIYNAKLPEIERALAYVIDLKMNKLAHDKRYIPAIKILAIALSKDAEDSHKHWREMQDEFKRQKAEWDRQDKERIAQARRDREAKEWTNRPQYKDNGNGWLYDPAYGGWSYDRGEQY